MALVITPPSPLRTERGTISVFLAGSIKLGGASVWQGEIERMLADAPVTIWSPRRDAWDASLFREQVEWELEAQERADRIVMYFEPATRAPNTLLELGLFARSGKLVVSCPAGFWRKGNVDVVCARYGVPMVNDLTALAAAVRAASA